MIDVVIAARSPALRRGLRALLEAGAPHAAAALGSQAGAPHAAAALGSQAGSQSDGIRVVGEHAVSNGRWSNRPHADVMVVGDPEWLPDNVDPDTAVVVLGDGTGLRRRLARTRGAGWALVPPDVSAELLRAVVTATALGMIVVPVSGAHTIGPGLGDPDADAEHDVDDEDRIREEALTTRELEVLERVASGLTNREIAGRMGISEHTVKFHLSTIYGKLGASTRTEAVRRAVHRGLVTL